MEDIALHAVMRHLDSGLIHKEYAEKTLLDIKLSFNYMRLEVVIRALENFKVKLNFKQYIYIYIQYIF